MGFTRVRLGFILFFTLTFVTARGAKDALAQAGESPQITITVHDSSDAVIDNAIVVLTMGTQERRGTTAVDGVVRFRDLEPGGWTAEVRKEGFALKHEPITVGPTPVTVSITLELPAI